MAGATAVSFDGVRNAGLGGVGLAVAGLAVVGLVVAGFVPAGFCVVGFAPPAWRLRLLSERGQGPSQRSRRRRRSEASKRVLIMVETLLKLLVR